MRLPSLAFIRNLSATTAIRLATFASRSILLFYMAKYLEPSDLGQYGLVAATVAYAVLAFGLEYHFYNTRQILSQPDIEGQALCMRNQLVMHLVLTPIGLPLLIAIFALGALPWYLAPYFYAILLLDHVAQEFSRFMMTLQRAMIANIMYFLRNAWIYPVVGLGIFYPSLRSLTWIWLGWIAGSGICVAVALYVLRDFPWKNVLSRPFDLPWTLKGFRVAAPYMVATLSSMSLPIADRYAISYFDRLSMVGVYTFYAAICGAVQSLVHANVGMLLYPRTVQAYMQGDYTAYRHHIRRLAWLAPAMAVFFAACAAGAIYPVLLFIDRPIYVDYLPLLWIGLGGTVMAAAAEAPHAALYVRHQDMKILLAEVLTAIIGLVCLVVLVPRFSVYGAVASIVVAWTALYLMRGLLLLPSRAQSSLAPEHSIHRTDA